jgi:hypothetical protein
MYLTKATAQSLKQTKKIHISTMTFPIAWQLKTLTLFGWQMNSAKLAYYGLFSLTKYYSFYQMSTIHHTSQRDPCPERLPPIAPARTSGPPSPGTDSATHY